MSIKRIRMRWLVVMLVLSCVMMRSEAARAQMDDPSKDDFVAVEEEPKEIVPIEKLIVYPELAQRAGLEGKVIASVLIDEEGKVMKVVIEKLDHEVFRQSTIDALMKARFTPARSNGMPLKFWVMRTINYKLTDPAPVDPMQARFQHLFQMSTDSLRVYFAYIGKVDVEQENGKTIIHSAARERMAGKPTEVTAVVDSKGVESIELKMYVPDDGGATAKHGPKARSKTNQSGKPITVGLEYPFASGTLTTDTVSHIVTISLDRKSR